MIANHVKIARQILGLNQTELASLLGWTSKRNIVSLERGDKLVTVQTALAIECLLRRAGKMEFFRIESDISDLLETQRAELISSSLSFENMQQIVLSDSDVVETYLSDNNISESDVDLESLRNMQHDLLNKLR